MLVLTIVTAIPMTMIHWDGTQASAQADDIDTLLNVMIVLSCFVFAVVVVMLGYCVWKYRAKPGDESDGEPIHGNTSLEIAWTVIPTVIVLFGAVYSAIVLGNIEKKDPNRMVLDVTAQQYKWSFAYPLPNGQHGQVRPALRPGRPPARAAPHRGRRPALLLGARVADQARPRPRRPERQPHRQHGRRHARQGRRLQPGLHRAVRASGTRRWSAFVHVLPQDQFQSWLTKQEKPRRAAAGRRCRPYPA